MAELVDALVSKTSEVTLVPVRSRLRVQKKRKSRLAFSFCFNNVQSSLICYNTLADLSNLC